MIEDVFKSSVETILNEFKFPFTLEVFVHNSEEGGVISLVVNSVIKPIRGREEDCLSYIKGRPTYKRQAEEIAKKLSSYWQSDIICHFSWDVRRVESLERKETHLNYSDVGQMTIKAHFPKKGIQMEMAKVKYSLKNNTEVFK